MLVFPVFYQPRIVPKSAGRKPDNRTNPNRSIHDPPQQAKRQPMKRIAFTVPAIPIAQPRPRATAFGGRARVYESKSHPVAAFKASVRLAAQQAYEGAPMDGPLRVDLDFVFPRTKGQVWKKRPMPRLLHTKKPDRDNCDKAVMDALTGLLWMDDCQVCEGEIRKFIAAGDEQPHVVVVVQPLVEG